MWSAIIAGIVSFLAGVLTAVGAGEKAREYFGRAARLERRARRTNVPESLRSLPADILLLAVERPFAWEYRLFEKLLAKEIADSQHLRLTAKYGDPQVSPAAGLPEPQVFEWLQDRMHALTALVETSDRLVNVGLQEALGPQGEPGDPQKLFDVAHRLGDVYRSAIHWSLDFGRPRVPTLLQRLVQLTSRSGGVLTAGIEELHDKLWYQLERAMATSEHLRTGARVDVSIPSIMTPELAAEFQRLQEHYDQLGSGA
jgi:hypothetical protein